MRSTVQRYSNAVNVTDRTSGSSISVWLTPEEFRQLDEYARAKDMSRTAVVRQLIRDLKQAEEAA